jgi:hypothetical protein
MAFTRKGRKLRYRKPLTQAKCFVVNYMRSIALYVFFTMLKTKATAAREGFRRLCEHRLERRGEVDRERARANDTGNSRRPVEQVTLVLVTVRLELLRGPDRGVFVDVGLAVADAELVHVASLTAAPKIYRKNKTSASNQPSVSSLINDVIIERFPVASAARTRFGCNTSQTNHTDCLPISIQGATSREKITRRDTHVFGAEPASVEPL